MIVEQLGVDRFLRDYWQKRPVLLRQALPGFVDPISPEELAGLACECEVESRLVFTKPRSWQLKTGPFRVNDFTSLPKRNWTLLVQAVDQWVPAVRELMRSVPFLPSWRIDDIMISYATPNGGVGPHFDYYDVFLVQGLGKRLWKTGQRCTAQDALRTDSGLKLLQRFDTAHEYELAPGDVLYVPPGVAHWGVSVDDSMCYSIGFRAPSASETVLGHADELATGLPADLRYLDPKRRLPLRSGEITAADLAQAKQLLHRVLHDDAALARWFGRHMTEPRHPEQLQPAGLRPTARTRLRLHPASRLAWRNLPRHLQVFVDGETDLLPTSLALLASLQALSRGEAVTAKTLTGNAATKSWCTSLLRRGSLIADSHD
ncbi:MAG TPA: cupin domain-containing protein [Candidatus Acidoferrum sp.]|nr:cupin domain-containing protein [Candidatus Acidoferrum sp.]